MKKYLSFLFSFTFLLSIIISPLTSSALVVYNPDPISEDTAPVESSCLDLQNNLKYRNRDANTNNEVSSLQDFLQGKGYLNNEPTGYFGILTTKAVAEFQKANNISPAVGYVGSVTRAKIKASSCGDIPVTVCPSGTTGTYPNCVKDTTYPLGCNSNVGFSATTGLSCGNILCPTGTTGTYPNCVKDTTYPPGCASNLGYSTTTGLSCSDGTTTNCTPTSAPSITVLSPNGGEVYKAGQEIAVKWKTCNLSPTNPIVINLEYTNQALSVNSWYGWNNNLLPSPTHSTINDGFESVNLMSESLILENQGKLEKNFKINVTGFVNGNEINDVSDNFFTINPLNSSCPTGATGAYPNCVSPNTKPIVNLTATPAPVQAGGSTQITWNSTNATSCIASDGWTGARSLNGAQIISNLKTSTTFTINCTGPGGVVSESIVVGVYVVDDFKPSVTLLSPNGGEVYKGGQQIKVKWETKNIPNTVNVKIVMLDEGGQLAGFPKTLFESTSNDGQEIFVLPTAGFGLGGSFKVSVSVPSHNINNKSNSYFAIVPNDPCPTGTTGIYPNCVTTSTESIIKVISPNGGEIQTLGKYSKFSFEVANVSSNIIAYLKSSDGDTCEMLKGNPKTQTMDFSFNENYKCGSWDFSPYKKYKFVVQSISGDIQDLSDDYFTFAFPVDEALMSYGKPVVNSVAPSPGVKDYNLWNFNIRTPINHPLVLNTLFIGSESGDFLARTENFRIIDSRAPNVYNKLTLSDATTDYPTFTLQNPINIPKNTAQTSFRLIADIKCDAYTNPVLFGGINRSFGSIKILGNAGGDVGPIVTSSSNSNCADKTPRIAYWSGKINQHIGSNGTWQTDPDGTSGANLDKLGYCMKWYPTTTSIKEYKSETINTWRTVYNTGPSYTTTVMTTECVGGQVLGASTENLKNACILKSNLAKGKKSEEVRCLQKKLNNKGYKILGTENGRETNEFGYYTMLALKKFQAENSLKADGILGLQTRALLNK